MSYDRDRYDPDELFLTRAMRRRLNKKCSICNLKIRWWQKMMLTRRDAAVVHGKCYSERRKNEAHLAALRQRRPRPIQGPFTTTGNPFRENASSPSSPDFYMPVPIFVPVSTPKPEPKPAPFEGKGGESGGAGASAMWDAAEPDNPVVEVSRVDARQLQDDADRERDPVSPGRDEARDDARESVSEPDTATPDNAPDSTSTETSTGTTDST